MLKHLKVCLGEILDSKEVKNMKMKMAFATCVQLGLSCIEEIYKIGGT